jgi:hypothetical protein
VFGALVFGEDDARHPSGEAIDHHERAHPIVEGDGQGDAERHADAASVETLLNDMREACRRVRDVWSELWRWHRHADGLSSPTTIARSRVRGRSNTPRIRRGR